MSSNASLAIRVSTAGDAGYLADPAGERLGGALHLREHVAEAVAFVVRDPGLLQRWEPTASTSVATPAPTTSATART
jgi:hypothetical protein